jgi:hypothetical protein
MKRLNARKYSLPDLPLNVHKNMAACGIGGAAVFSNGGNTFGQLI